VDAFIPSHQSLERELQELVAIVECTDVEFLPDTKRAKIDELGGREGLQGRINAIRHVLQQD
jgi:hypothetical protein